jgi:hypothetical protein
MSMSDRKSVLVSRPLSTTRRSILRGLGAGGVFLSGMWRTVSAQPTAQPTKAAFFYFANGPHPDWAPAGSGTNFTLTPHLEGLAPIKNDVIIFRKLMAQRVMSLNPHKGATLDLSSGGGPITFDQVLAQHVKTTAPTPVPSLELAIGRTAGGGGVAPSLSRVGGQFLPGIRNPLFLYERLAGAISPGNPMVKDPGGAAMEGGLRARKSLLDFLKDDVNVLRTRAGGRQKQQMDLYLDALRDLEGKLGGFAGEVRSEASCSKGMPPATAMDFEAHISDMPKVSRMFSDAIAMGFACGVTRVSSMMWGGGECAEPASWLGVGSWHSTSHGNPVSAGQQKLIKLQSYFAEEFAYFVGRLKTLGIYDSTTTLLATQNGNSTETGFSKENHDRHNAWFVLSGRGGGYFNSLGKVVDCADRSHNDLYVHMAKAFGLKVDTIGTAAWNQGPLPGVV